ncbi:hypothetical protein CP8484711_0542, partial [Chlamydia psittaci 84-8471/1]
MHVCFTIYLHEENTLIPSLLFDNQIVKHAKLCN